MGFLVISWPFFYFNLRIYLGLRYICNYICNSSTQEAEAEGLQIQGWHVLQEECHPNLGYIGKLYIVVTECSTKATCGRRVQVGSQFADVVRCGRAVMAAGVLGSCEYALFTVRKQVSAAVQLAVWLLLSLRRHSIAEQHSVGFLPQTFLETLLQILL